MREQIHSYTPVCGSSSPIPPHGGTGTYNQSADPNELKFTSVDLDTVISAERSSILVLVKAATGPTGGWIVSPAELVERINSRGVKKD